MQCRVVVKSLDSEVLGLGFFRLVSEYKALLINALTYMHVELDHPIDCPF